MLVLRRLEPRFAPTATAGGYGCRHKAGTTKSISSRPPGAAIEKARDLMSRSGIDQHWPLVPALRHGIAAAGGEGAARGRIDRARHVAIDQRREAFGAGIGHGHRG